MGARDVIITALACGGKMSCRKQAAEFAEPPAIISINSSTGVSTGGGTVQGFRKAASEYRKSGDGSVLKGVLKTQKNLRPRRIALVSYLAGWSFIHELLKYDFPVAINTIIVLDGINTRSIDPWEGYAAHGKLWLAFSQSTHKTASSRSAANKLNSLLPGHPKDLPKYLAEAQLEKSVSIYSKNETPKTKIYHTDPLVKSTYTTQDGSELMSLEYKGAQSQDQTYVQQYVQPRLWRLLREHWG
jgi:hypothetical protein